MQLHAITIRIILLFLRFCFLKYFMLTLGYAAGKVIFLSVLSYNKIPYRLCIYLYLNVYTGIYNLQ